MKVAVTTIVKNEALHLPRWADSARDADLLHVTDTGSTDDTIDVAVALGIMVGVVDVIPWRFDDARNAALALLPPDIDWVITLDADEVLEAGWREKFDEAAARAAETGARRMSYDYTWNHTESGDPDIKFRADRCHTRSGWRWHGPVHEVLVPSGWETRAEPASTAVASSFRISHHADNTKSRSSYLPLLQLAVAEEPHNPRQAHYLARELFFAGRWDLARPEFVRFLAMPEAVWTPERVQSYRYIAAMDDDPETWLLKAVEEDPERRDALVDLVDHYVMHQRWESARDVALRALEIQDRPDDYLTSVHSYDDEHLRRVIARAEERMAPQPVFD